jgi:Holliday junction resolvase-like predicted endonuclease
LRLRGWRLLARNLHVGPDELDIVAAHPTSQVLAIVEVKATRGGVDTLARVDARKQRRMARAADRLPARWRAGRRLRFDVASVRVGLWCRIRYRPGAFEDAR